MSRTARRPLLCFALLLLFTAGVARPPHTLFSSEPAFGSSAIAGSRRVHTTRPNNRIELIFQAYQAIYSRYYDPVDGPGLLDAAWRAAVAAAGVAVPPAAPDVSLG